MVPVGVPDGGGREADVADGRALVRVAADADAEDDAHEQRGAGALVESCLRKGLPLRVDEQPRERAVAQQVLVLVLVDVVEQPPQDLVRKGARSHRAPAEGAVDEGLQWPRAVDEKLSEGGGALPSPPLRVRIRREGAVVVAADRIDVVERHELTRGVAKPPQDCALMALEPLEGVRVANASRLHERREAEGVRVVARLLLVALLEHPRHLGRVAPMQVLESAELAVDDAQVGERVPFAVDGLQQGRRA